MGSHQSNVTSINQSFMTNISQESMSNCIATTNVDLNNNTIIVENATISGNLDGLSNATTTDATCVMVSNIQSSISNILSASIKQSASSQSGIAGDFSWNKNTNKASLTQTVVNNISQINEQNCIASAIISVNGNYIFYDNINVGGNVSTISNTATTFSDCAMTTTMSASTTNSATASVTQSASQTGMFVAIFEALFSAMTVIAIAAIIIVAIGGLGYAYTESKTNNNPGGINKEQQLANDLKAVGLKPEDVKINPNANLSQ